MTSRMALLTLLYGIVPILLYGNYTVLLYGNYTVLCFCVKSLKMHDFGLNTPRFYQIKAEVAGIEPTVETSDSL